MTDEFKTISDKIGEGYYSEKRSKFLAFARHITSELLPNTEKNILMRVIAVMLMLSGQNGRSIGKTMTENLRRQQENLLWGKFSQTILPTF